MDETQTQLLREINARLERIERQTETTKMTYAAFSGAAWLFVIIMVFARYFPFGWLFAGK